MNGPFDELGKVVAVCTRSLHSIVDGFRSVLVARYNAKIDPEAVKPIERPQHPPELGLQLIAESIPAPIAVMTPAGEVEVVNQPVLEYFGKTLDELKGWRTADAVHPNDLPHVVAVWTEAIQTGCSYEVESRHRRADGVYRWFHVHGFPLRDREARIVNWCVMLTDIDEQKRAEALLAGENRIFEMVARGLPLTPVLDALCRLVESILSGWNCCILLIEPGSARFRRGAAPSFPSSYNEALNGRTDGDKKGPFATAALLKRQIIVPDIASDPRWDASDWRELALSSGLRSCVSTPIMSGDQKVLGTLDIYAQESEGLDPLQLELIGQFVQIASIAIDRAQGEVALKRSETFLAEGEHLSRVGTFSWRVATDEIRWSKELYRIFEFDDHVSLTLELVSSRVHPDDIAQFGEMVNLARGSGADLEYEYRLLMPDRSIKYIHVTARATRDEEGRLEYIGAAQDVTERRLSEEALRDIVDTIPALVSRHRSDGVIDFVNQTWRSYTGLSQADWLRTANGQLAAGAITHPNDWRRVEKEWLEHLKTGEPLETEQRLRRSDGEYRWHFIRRVPLRDDDGNVVAWYGAGHDIEDRKRAEDALREREGELRESEARLAKAERELRLTLDTIPTLAWRTDPDGSADYLNKRWLDFTGFALEQGVGWNWQNAIHPDDRRPLLEAWKRMLQFRKPEDVEARMRRFDGAYRWFLFRAETLRDDSGNIVAWFGTNTDIEDRKQAEGSLKRSEAYAAEAQKLSQTGSVVWDMARENHFWSDEAYQIIGFDRSTKPTLDLILQRVHPDDRILVLREVRRVAQGEQNFDYEHRLLMDDGQIKYVKVRARRVRHDTGKEEVVGALMDITATRKSQEALHTAQTALAHASRVATLGEINATIAHEVNQPLAAIIANAETSLRRFAGKSPDYDRIRRAVERIAKDARRAGDVIQHVRGLSRKADTQKVALDLNEVIDEVNALLRRDLAAHRVNLRLELAPFLPLVMGDRVQLQQVLINLVMNAVEAMQSAASGTNSLVVRSCFASNGVVVAVTDSGVGISDEARSRLFDAFFSTKQNGLGIGLAICRSIIEDHEGKLSAANNDGEPGATFKFELPSLSDHAV